MKHKINIYGEGVRIWLCHVEDELFQKMNRARKELPWESVLFDLEFLEHFGFQHWSELAKTKEQIGFYLTERNIIEIKKGNKRLSKFFANDLIATNLLFPMYDTIQTQFVNSDDCSFVLLEYETGLVMSYSIESDNLIMDELTFELASIQGETLLSGIRYKNKILGISKSDTVVRGNNVIQSARLF